MAVNFDEKSSRCGEALKRWASQEFGSIGKRKKELTEKLKELTDQIAKEMHRMITP